MKMIIVRMMSHVGFITRKPILRRMNTMTVMAGNSESLRKMVLVTFHPAFAQKFGRPFVGLAAVLAKELGLQVAKQGIHGVGVAQNAPVASRFWVRYTVHPPALRATA
jgi:hypothetical protein